LCLALEPCRDAQLFVLIMGIGERHLQCPLF